VEMALDLLDPTVNMFLITSWNEWHEDTSIEPEQSFKLDYLNELSEALSSR
jgi:hypothetical protein